MATVRVGCPTEIDGAAYYIAQQKGYFKDAGLDVTLVEYEPSKSMETKTLLDGDDGDDNASWDIGLADAMQVIEGEILGIVTVGISSDKSTTNQLVANPQGVSLWPLRSMSKEHPIVLSVNSTIEYTVRACMKSHGYKMEDVLFINKPQTGCLGEMIGGDPRVNFGGFEFPYMYELLEKEGGSEVICSAASAYEKIAGGIVVESRFAEQKPEVVKRVLASWFRAIEFMNDNDNKDEVIEYLRVFFLDRDIHLSWESLEHHLQSTGLFGIDRQLDLMKQRGSEQRSIFDEWVLAIGHFMIEIGMRPHQPNPRDYIKDDFLQMIQEDSKLYDFAKGNSRPEDYPGVGIKVPAAAAIYESEREGGLNTGFLLGFVIMVACIYLFVKRSSPISYFFQKKNKESHQGYSPLDTSHNYIELADQDSNDLELELS